MVGHYASRISSSRGEKNKVFGRVVHKAHFVYGVRFLYVFQGEESKAKIKKLFDYFKHNQSLELFNGGMSI